MSTTATKSSSEKRNLLKKFKNLSTTKQRVALGVAGAVVLFGISRIPVLRTVALPFVAKAATNNWQSLRGMMGKA